MRFKYKMETIRSERMVERFLWLPKCIQNEWRWFEFARWKEKALFRFDGIHLTYSPISTDKPTVNYRWSAIEWLDGVEWPRE